MVARKHVSSSAGMQKRGGVHNIGTTHTQGAREEDGEKKEHGTAPSGARGAGPLVVVLMGSMPMPQATWTSGTSFSVEWYTISDDCSAE